MLQIVQNTQPAAPMLALRALSPFALPEVARQVSEAILAHGGWILTRSASAADELTIVFEFECKSCLDMYGVLVSTGLAVSKKGHMQMTQLWQCVRLGEGCPCLHIARITLTVFAPKNVSGLAARRGRMPI